MNMTPVMSTTLQALAPALQRTLEALLPLIFIMMAAFLAIEVVWSLIEKAFGVKPSNPRDPLGIWEDFSTWEDVPESDIEFGRAEAGRPGLNPIFEDFSDYEDDGLGTMNMGSD